jgi:hypothetical protein
MTDVSEALPASIIRAIALSKLSHIISLIYILILSYHLHLGLSNRLFSSMLPNKIVLYGIYIYIYIMRATCPAHHIPVGSIMVVYLKHCKVYWYFSP